MIARYVITYLDKNTGKEVTEQRCPRHTPDYGISWRAVQPGCAIECQECDRKRKPKP